MDVGKGRLKKVIKACRTAKKGEKTCLGVLDKLFIKGDRRLCIKPCFQRCLTILIKKGRIDVFMGFGRPGRRADDSVRLRSQIQRIKT